MIYFLTGDAAIEKTASESERFRSRFLSYLQSPEDDYQSVLLLPYLIARACSYFNAPVTGAGYEPVRFPFSV